MVLATFPLTAGHTIFNVVFFVVLISTAVDRRQPRGLCPVAVATYLRAPSRCDDQDVGQHEPGGLVTADDGQAVVGQQRTKRARFRGVTPAQSGHGRTSAPGVGEGIGDNQQPTRPEHPADLGRPRWLVRPVPQG